MIRADEHAAHFKFQVSMSNESVKRVKSGELFSGEM